MSLDNCIQTAINAGEVDAELGRRAQEEFRNRVQRHVDQGYAPLDARMMAGDEVMDSIIKRTKSERHATVLQLQTMAKNQGRYARAHIDDPDLILKDLEQVQAERAVIQRQFMSGIHDFLASFRTNVIGQMRQRAMLAEVVKELHGEASGNAMAHAIAQGVLKQYEVARSMANALGMDIPKLADWGIRHTHDARKIEDAGFDAWFAKLYDGKMLDWSRIENFATGKPFAVAKGARPLRADAERFLRDIYAGIRTGDWDSRNPSMVNIGKSLKNARQESRILHFDSAEKWMAYNDEFGTGNPFEAIVGHFSSMARDIALMRAFGPSPNGGLTHALQVIEKAAANATGPDGAVLRKMRDLNARKGKKAKVMMNIITGANNVPHHTFWAAFFAGTRNLLTAAQLGSAPISSVTDWVSARLAAQAVGLNGNSATTAMMRQIVKGFSPQQAKDMGFIFDTWFDTGSSQARFMGDVWAPEITSRITNFVLRANGLAFLTDRARVASAAAFGSDLADLSDKAWADLPQNLRTFMETRNITAADWDALRDPAAIYTDPTGGRHINHEWFRVHTSLPPAQAQDIAIRWGALVQTHMELAIPTASLRGRATLMGDVRPGTFIGELALSSVMYKSFALSQLFNQIRRIQEIDGGPKNRWIYGVRYVAAMTVVGALALQLKEVAKGRDPRPMNPLETPAFWFAALLQGGGIGIFGDFFSSGTSRTGGGIGEVLAGPVVGVAGDVQRAVVSNMARVAEGKDPLIGRDVANLARRYNPLATFQPPIPVPTRLALDRMLWDQLQKILDPEAEDQWRQAERKLKRDFNTQSWWSKGEMRPARAPDLSNAIRGGQ